MFQESQFDERELVVPLRPSETAVATVSLLVFLGAMILFLLSLMLPTLTSSAPIYLTLTVSLSLALMVPALVCIFYRCRARLVLAEAGLRWRTWGDWRQVSWDGVQDYFDLPPQGNNTGDGLMTIRTDAGDVLLNSKWQESEAVRGWVQARATHTAVTEWGVYGERSHAADTRTFVYRQNGFWFMLLFGCGVLLPSTGYWWYEILRPRRSSFFAGAWNPSDFWGSLITIILFAIIVLGGIVIINLPLLVFLALLPGMLETRKRRKERITTDRKSVV